ncbi:MAG: 6-pyruvoyl-tetrahydropterin synthase-related protein, partial [Anaerolineae bacterium]
MLERIRTLAKRIDPGLALACLLALFAFYPLLQPGLPNTADGVLHLYRAVELDQCWQDGVYYPRWAPDLFLGYGYPIFNFYAPLLYFLAEALHVLGFSFQGAIKVIQVGTFLLYGLGMYVFAREIVGRKPALLAAAAYAYVPYRFKEAFVQGDYPQFLALALLPLVFWAFYKIIVTRKSVYIVLGAGLYGALILSHNITAMLTSAFLGLYIVWMILSTPSVSKNLGEEGGWGEDEGSCRNAITRLWPVLVALGLGVGLTAFFWLPALYEKRWVQLDLLTKGFFDFRQYFLSLGELLSPSLPLDTAASNPYMPFNLGLAQVLLSLVAVLALLPRFGLRWEEKSHLLFSLVSLFLCVFMMLPVSTPLWERVPFLAFTEFPWRLLGLAGLFTALPAGMSLRLLTNRGRLSPAFIALALSLVLLPTTAFVYLYPRQPFIEYPDPTPADIVEFELESHAWGTTSGSEYLTIWLTEKPKDSSLLPLYRAGQPISKLDNQHLPEGVRAEMLDHSVVSDSYHFAGPQAFTARFNTFYFPGWRAYLDGQPVAIQISQPHALIEVAIPPGAHTLLLRFQDTPVRLLANGLSLAALLVTLIILIRSRLTASPIPHPLHCISRPTDDFSQDQALLLCAVILALFAVKEVLVDPYTSWFRRHSPLPTVLGAQHAAQINLGDKVLFLGYDLADEVVRQGEDLHLVLYWQAQQPLERQYSVFAHLDAPPDYTTWAGSDNLNPGGIPTSRWAPALYTRDEHTISIPADLPPVEYLLQVGLYDKVTGDRLPILSEGGQALRHGSGQALRHGSGQALRHGSGQALRRGSGQALRRG